MKKTLILLAMVIALVILPFLSITAASTVVQTARRKVRFRPLRHTINPGSSRCMNPQVGKSKACSLPCKDRWARRLFSTFWGT